MCNSLELSSILYTLKNIILIIQIIVPIILIISIIIRLTIMIINPDEKKNIKSLTNSFIAAIIIFFIPMLINLTMNIIGENTNFSSCWINAKKYSNNSSYIKSNNKSKSIIPTTSDYEKGNKKSQSITTTFNLQHAIKVHDNVHWKGNSNLPWQGKLVGNYGGDIGAYTEAVNILNETDYRIYEVYKVIVSYYPDITTKQMNISKLTKVNNYYNIKTGTIPANMESINKALQKGQLVHGVSTNNHWTDSKGNHAEWKGTHNGLIFYFDGTYYHMKAAGSINQNDSIYTTEQLQLWLDGCPMKNIIVYYK